MARLTRAEILARKVGNDIVTLPGGGDVEVRGLTRKEAVVVQNADEDGGRRDATMLSLALVDPVMSVDEVLGWFDVASAGDVNAITAVVLRLSGMAPGQAKDATKSVPR